jgi:hypothetical protein
MQTPQRVLPVIEYEKANLSPWPDVMRMMGTIGIALGAVLAFNSVRYVGELLRPYAHDWYHMAGFLTFLLSLLLLAGGIGCRCLQGWGRMLLLLWACLAPVAGACFFLAHLARIWMNFLGTSEWVYSGAIFLHDWLRYCLFPLMIILLLRPRENWNRLISGGPTATLSLQGMIRGISVLGITLGILTPVTMLATLRSFHVHPSMMTRGDIFRIVTYYVSEGGLCIMLWTASIGCWRLRPWARPLFAVYAILWVVYRAIWSTMTIMSIRRSIPLPGILVFTLPRIIDYSPFALVIVLLMFRRQIRAVFVRPSDER